MKTPGRFLLTVLAPLALFHAATALRAAPPVQYVEPSKPYGASPFLKGIRKGTVNPKGPLLVPLITWAADGVTVAANGGLDPAAGSPLAAAVGRPVQLEVTDDFNKQVENYVTGKSPFLRGTADMIALVAQALKGIDPGLEPVVVFQLSTSTGADGFVAKDISQVSDLKGKTIVTQINGPHLSLIGNMLRDAGLSARDVNIRFVNDITAAPDWKDTSPATDPANAFRRDPQLSGAACISPDIQALVGSAKDGVGTGQEGTMKGARAIFTTRTADNIIFDVYAVRRDFLERNPGVVKGFREKHLAEQEYFLAEIDNIEKKNGADKDRVSRFKTLCKPLAKIFNQDEAAVNDYVIWVGSGLHLAGRDGNKQFFEDGNPVGFGATTARIQEFFKELGLISSPAAIAVSLPDDPDLRITLAPATRPPGTDNSGNGPAGQPAPTQVTTVSANGNKVLFAYSFPFPAQSSDINWRDYVSVFAQIHAITSRYGGAGIELRGHVDNFLYNFVTAKRNAGQTTYERRVGGTSKYETLPLPALEDILKDADTLSLARAEAVKTAYQRYVQENFKTRTADPSLSRFDAKGMGIKEPMVKEPKTKVEMERNMRVEMVVLAVESELPPGIVPDDLR